jgi:hypothetical protein
MITTKNVRETTKELAHTQIYNNNVKIGYVIQNKSQFAQVGENWNYDPQGTGLEPMFATTKRKLIDKIKSDLVAN